MEHGASLSRINVSIRTIKCLDGNIINCVGPDTGETLGGCQGTGPVVSCDINSLRPLWRRAVINTESNHLIRASHSEL